jgi:inhibitor of growth protein 3
MPNKSNLSRVKKASNRNSPAPTNDSELSDVDSGSGEEEEGADGRSRGTPVADGKDMDGDDIVGDADEDDEEAGDDKKYCLCHNVSYGDMVACDNDNCPYEWFHWSCVGLKSEPNGTWYCPVCAEKFKKSK